MLLRFRTLPPAEVPGQQLAQSRTGECRDLQTGLDCRTAFALDCDRNRTTSVSTGLFVAFRSSMTRLQSIQAPYRRDHKKTILSPIQIWGIAMRYSSQVKPISYLKANAAEVLTYLAERREPMVITQNGEAKAVLQDVASFEETQETLALLKILALGNQDVTAGKVKPAAEIVARLRGKRATA